jgi:hypothetical protein
MEDSPGVAIAKFMHSKGYQLVSWDDEKAIIPDVAKPISNFEEFIETSDFIVVTRPFSNSSQIMKKIEDRNKPYLDLWRQS